MAPMIMQDELIDDSTNVVPAAGLKSSLSLQDRFKYRLGRMLGKSVAVIESEDSSTISIYIGPVMRSVQATFSYDERTRKFTEDLQCSLRDIANSSNELQRDEASEDQWDIILIYVSRDIDETVNEVKELFQRYHKKFDAVVTQVLGVDNVDEDGSSLDTELGDRIIWLQQLARAYDGSIKQQNELIEFAWSLIHRCPALDVRLRSFLGSTFSNVLYNRVCRLSHPKSTHHSLVRAAVTFAVFRTVHILLRSPPVLSPKALTLPPKVAPTVQQPQALQLRRSPSPARYSTPLRGNIMDTIRPYLPEEDRGLSLFRLQPAAKQAAALLIGCVLNDTPVPPGSDTYHVFGFATCRTGAEEHGLYDFYRQLLDTSLDPTIVFGSIVKAVEFNTLTGLLHNRVVQNLNKSHPSLNRFLNLAPEDRPSVFRLVQFIRDSDNDEPLPCLKRDYGFKFCTQREHVARLKALYTKVLEESDPLKLHNACIHGRLLHFVIKILGWVDHPMRRLLQNDYPQPFVGFDNARGLELYMIPLFKRSLKS